MRLDVRLGLVLACFLLSGAAALLYQTAWTREFAFVFGTSELAVVSVLAAYMGGLALGSALAARLVPAVRRPVLVYGLLELGIGVSALLVPLAIRATTHLFVLAFGGREAPADALGMWGALFHVAAAMAILVVPTAMMGATLPLLARHAVRRDVDLGPRVALLYTTNTVGGVAGALAAGFLLLPAIGLRNTVWVGAATNALVFGLAVLLARSSAPAEAAAHDTPAKATRTRDVLWVLPAIAISGAVSFSYEVVWTRLLGHVLGGSVKGFVTMLASFLLGIALGSAFAMRASVRRERAAPGFAIAQLGVAALSLVAFAALDALPGFAQAVGAGWSGSALANATVAAAVLLPGALCIGATFPFAVRALARDVSDAAAATARVYAWNTVGAIVGALGAGFLLVPGLGVEGTIAAAAATNLLLALAATLATRGRVASALRTLAAAGLVLLALAPPTRPWQLLRHSALGDGPEGRVTYAADGRSASVLLLERAGEWQLRTNGLPESAIQGPGSREAKYADVTTLATLPALLRPETRTLLIVGLGGGQVAEAVPASIERITVVELEPRVVDAARAIADLRRRDPLADPRVELALNDARSALLLSDARFDAIVSQPSHPWTAGASHLYTREFFTLVHERLTGSGVFVQWMNDRFVDEPLLQLLVATFADVFPHVAVFHRGDSLLLAGSGQPLEPAASAPVAIASDPERYALLGFPTRESLLAAQLLDDVGARSFAAGAPVNTDDRNRLADRSAGVAPLRKSGVDAVFARVGPPALGDADRAYMSQLLADAGELGRARAMAASIPDPAEREAALAHVARNGGQLERAGELARSALARDPENERARALLLQARSARPAELSDPTEIEALLAEARDPDATAALDHRLAGVDPRHPLYLEALRARASWRIATGDPARAREALTLADLTLVVRRDATGFALRIRAATAARDIEATLASFEEVLHLTKNTGMPPSLARLYLSLLAPVPHDPNHPDRRPEIERRLREHAQP